MSPLFAARIFMPGLIVFAARLLLRGSIEYLGKFVSKFGDARPHGLDFTRGFLVRCRMIR